MEEEFKDKSPRWKELFDMSRGELLDDIISMIVSLLRHNAFDFYNVYSHILKLDNACHDELVDLYIEYDEWCDEYE